MSEHNDTHDTNDIIDRYANFRSSNSVVLRLGDVETKHFDAAHLANILLALGDQVSGPFLDVQIADANFEKTIQLSAIGRDENLLLKLSFSNCMFERGLTLDFTRFAELSLLRCKAPLISAKHVEVLGDVSMIGIEPVAQGGNCRLDLTAANVGKKLKIESSHLCLAAQVDGPKAWIPDYALELGLTKIGDDIVIWKGNRISDGINLSDARVGGILWLINTTIGDVRGTAIYGQRAQVTGGVSCGPDEMHSKVELHGDLDLLDAKIGLLFLEGAKISADKSKIAVELSRAKIAGPVSICPRWIKGVAQPAQIIGSICCQDAEISGDLFLEGVEIESNQPLNLRQSLIHGDVRLGYDYDHASGNTYATKLECGVNCVAAAIGKSLILHGFSLNKDIDAAGARIQDEIQVYGLSCDRSDPPLIDLRNVQTRVLNDGHGANWAGFRFRLGGLRYDFSRDPNDFSGERYRRRVAFIERQTGGDSKQSYYNPDPYNHAARTYRNNGQFSDADGIIEAKMRKEYGLSAKKHWIFAPLIILASWLYRTFFRYGLSTSRALGTLAALIALGSVLVWFANSNNLMTVSALPTVAAVSDTEPRSIMFPAISGANGVRSVPCGNEIVPALYAMDVFIPLIDLGQEAKCDFEGSARWQSTAMILAKALYKLLGWLAVSLTILTVSGLLRRQIDG